MRMIYAAISTLIGNGKQNVVVIKRLHTTCNFFKCHMIVVHVLVVLRQVKSL